MLHTYDGDGDPLPSFSGMPYGIELPGEDGEQIAANLWENLDAENRVALAVKTIDRETGRFVINIVNQLDDSTVA